MLFRSDHMQDVDKRFGETMGKIEGLDSSFTAKLDEKFQVILCRLPHAPRHAGRAQRVPLQPAQTSAAGAAAADARHETYDGEDEYEGENEAEDGGLQTALGRPRVHPRNARLPLRPLVRDDDHVAKLKLHVPPFDGRYNPDAYLSWELELEQRFSCLDYPEERRFMAATCEFTSFASIWWSEYCRLHHDNPPTTWTDLKRAMRTRFVPP